MSTEELKALIHQRVEESENLMVLEAIAELLADIEQEPKLAQWQKDRIEASRQQFEEGKYYAIDEVLKGYLD